MSNEIPEGATHEHKGNDDEEVYQWLALRPEWGHWSDIPVYDEDNKENYIKINK